MFCAGSIAAIHARLSSRQAHHTAPVPRCPRRSHLATSPIHPTAVPDRIRDHPLASARPRVGLQGTLITLGLLLVIGWAFRGTQVSLGELITSAPNMWDLITRMVPPDWAFFSNYSHVIEPTLVTIQLAISS